MVVRERLPSERAGKIRRSRFRYRVSRTRAKIEGVQHCRNATEITAPTSVAVFDSVCDGSVSAVSLNLHIDPQGTMLMIEFDVKKEKENATRLADCGQRTEVVRRCAPSNETYFGVCPGLSVSSQVAPMVGSYGMYI